jgi:hypothetical protein
VGFTVSDTANPSFDDLASDEKDRYRELIHEFLAFAQEHTIPLYFAPPLVTVNVPGGRTVKLPLTLGKIDGASGSVLQLKSGFFFVTADHVLAGDQAYEERVAAGERLDFRIGKLPPFDPVERIAWRDNTAASDRSLMPYRTTDIVMLRLTAGEASLAGGPASIIPEPGQWPPAALKIGDPVFMAGYPNQLGRTDLAGNMYRDACALVFHVTHVGEGYCKCQFAYQDLIDFKTGAIQPALADINLGGMSGSPVFSIAMSASGLIQFPRLCGVFTDRWGSDPNSDIIEIATFDQVRLENIA